MRRLLALFAIAAAETACGGIRPATPAGPLKSPNVRTVESFARDAANTPAPLVIVVRDVDNPNRSVPQATVFLGRDKISLQSASALHGFSDVDGVVTFEHLDAGEHTILVRRMAYAPFQFVVTLRPQCREVLEIYVGNVPLCLFQCPSTPGRATLTTCGRPPTER